MKKILTKNKFVFRHYPFMKKNTDEKQILFFVTILLLICYNKLLICYNKL